jgi:hypothetical protein
VAVVLVTAASAVLEEIKGQQALTVRVTERAAEVAVVSRVLLEEVPGTGEAPAPTVLF